MKKITPRKRNTAFTKAERGAHVKRKAVRRSNDNIGLREFANVCLENAINAREHSAVMASQVRRLLAEKDLLLGRIADLERAQGTIPATKWDKQAQAWRVVA